MGAKKCFMPNCENEAELSCRCTSFDVNCCNSHLLNHVQLNEDHLHSFKKVSHHLSMDKFTKEAILEFLKKEKIQHEYTKLKLIQCMNDHCRNMRECMKEFMSEINNYKISSTLFEKMILDEEIPDLEEDLILEIMNKWSISNIFAKKFFHLNQSANKIFQEKWQNFKLLLKNPYSNFFELHEVAENDYAAKKAEMDFRNLLKKETDDKQLRENVEEAKKQEAIDLKMKKKLYFSDFTPLTYAGQSADSSTIVIKFNRWSKGCSFPKLAILKRFYKKREIYRKIARDLEKLSSLCPNRFVKYYHRQTIEGRYCIFMEWCEHFSVGNKMRTENYWNVKTRLRISSEILDALSDLHKCGRVHRDVKPDNIWLTCNDEVRIGGLDLQEDIRLCWYPRNICGTSDYMSPFLKLLFDNNIQVDWSIDPYKEDVWSAGITLYEIFTLENRSSLLRGYNFSKETSIQEENGVKERARIRMHECGLQDEAIEIILDMLSFNSEDRIAMEEANDRLKKLSIINKEAELKSEKIFLVENKEHKKIKDLSISINKNKIEDQLSQASRESATTITSLSLNPFYDIDEVYKDSESSDGSNGKIKTDILSKIENGPQEAEKNKISTIENNHQISNESLISFKNAVSDEQCRNNLNGFCEKCKDLNLITSFINEQAIIEPSNKQICCIGCGNLLSKILHEYENINFELSGLDKIKEFSTGSSIKINSLEQLLVDYKNPDYCLYCKQIFDLRLKIYKGKVRDTGEDIAVKVITSYDPHDVKNYMNEVKIYENLSNKNSNAALKYYGYANMEKPKKKEIKYKHYIFMESYEYRLSDEIFELKNKKQHYQNHILAQKVRDLLDLFKMLSQENIVYCNIDPQNIFIVDGGKFKLGDFYFSKTSEASDLASSGAIYEFGDSSNYMAPEILLSYSEKGINTGNLAEKRQLSTEKSEVFSLGLVILMMIVLGSIDGLNMDEYRYRLDEAIENLELGWAKWILRKMLATNCEERPNFKEALQMLEENPEFNSCLNFSN